MANKIRLNRENGLQLGGKTFISLLKAQQITSKVLKELICYDNNMVYPGLGKLVEYNGPYIRVS